MAKQKPDLPLHTIPYVGPWIDWVRRNFGIKVSLVVAAFFLIGFFSGGYVGFKFASTTGNEDRTVVTRTVPGSVQLDILRDHYAWSVMFEDFLVSEVERERKSLAASNESMIYATSRLVHRIKKPYARFTWALDGRGDYRIAALGFVVRGNGSVELLNRTAKADETSVVFDVPDGEIGDRLIAIVVVKWQKPSRSILDVRDAFSSHAG